MYYYSSDPETSLFGLVFYTFVVLPFFLAYKFRNKFLNKYNREWHEKREIEENQDYIAFINKWSLQKDTLLVNTKFDTLIKSKFF